jgi:hypothetical protein
LEHFEFLANLVPQLAFSFPFTRILVCNRGFGIFQSASTTHADLDFEAKRMGRPSKPVPFFVLLPGTSVLLPSEQVRLDIRSDIDFEVKTSGKTLPLGSTHHGTPLTSVFQVPC